jgi:uncharacterized alkaline shock family protein YloU
VSSSSSAAPTAELAPERPPLSTARGRTTIAPIVVEKILLRSAAEVDGVGPVVHTGLARLVPWVASGTPAEAEVGRESVTVDLAVSVRYPLPVRQVAASLRDHASRRIEELTGLAVRRVDITVAELVFDQDRPSPRVA